jgi:hypothetical protein
MRVEDLSTPDLKDEPDAPAEPQPMGRPALVFGSMMLPALCPACGALADREIRFHERMKKPPQFTAEYVCGTVITCMWANETQQTTNVSQGCRVMTLQSLLNSG